MSWNIKLLGIDGIELTDSNWDFIDTSTFGAYVSGMEYVHNGTAYTISDITVSTGATVTGPTGIEGMRDDVLINTQGTSIPNNYSSIFNQYDYLKVTNYSPTGANFQPKYLNVLDASKKEVEFEALGCQPVIEDESLEVNYWSGGYRKLKKGRLKFNIVCFPFTTRGDFTSLKGNKKYWDIIETLQKKGLYILSFGTDFERIFDIMNLYPTNFPMPIKVEVYDLGELSANFESNQDRLTFSLVSTEWFTFT